MNTQARVRSSGIRATVPKRPGGGFDARGWTKLDVSYSRSIWQTEEAKKKKKESVFFKSAQ